MRPSSKRPTATRGTRTASPKAASTRPASAGRAPNANAKSPPRKGGAVARPAAGRAPAGKGKAAVPARPAAGKTRGKPAPRVYDGTRLHADAARPLARKPARSAPAEFGQHDYARRVVVEAPPAVVRLETVDAERAGQRVDNFLSTRLKGVPKAAVYRAVRTGQVRINGKRCKPDTRLAAGDEVRIPPMHLPAPGEQVAPSDGLRDALADRIIHEDRDFLVLDKPSGLAAHGGSGISLGAIEAMRAIRPDETLELVHRLDRDTSGLMLLAKRHSALRKLQTLIRANQVQKRYLALIAGSPKRDRFEVDAPLRKNQLRGGERMVEVDDDDGKPSLSRFRVLERYADATLVEVEIVTGRTHQIRVHAQHAGHPLAGDDKYGDADFNKRMKAKGLKRLFLHAHSVNFAWGESGEKRSFSAPLAAELKALLDTLAG